MQTRVAEMFGMEFSVGSFGLYRDTAGVVRSKTRSASQRSWAGDRKPRSGQSVAQRDPTVCDQFAHPSGLLGEAVDR
jgi:hypothetical protein